MQYKYTIWLITLMTLMSFSALIAQNNTNPFDLKHRQTRQTEAEKKVIPKKDTLKIKKENPKESSSNSVSDSNAIDTSMGGLQEQGAQIVSRQNPESNSEQKNDEAGGYLLLMLLAVAGITTLIISYNRSVIQKIWRAILNDNFLNLVWREQKGRLSLQYLFLYFIFFINGGLFIYLCLEFFNPGGKYILWKAIMLVSIVYLLRHLSMAYIGSIYPFRKEVEQYAFTILIFNVFLGLILLPINAFVAFSPEVVQTTFVYIGLVMAGLLLIFRLLRGLFIGQQFLSFNKFHFFIYLCATEIAPIFLIIKFFQYLLV